MFEIIPYDLMLTIHIVAFVLNVALVVVADGLGALWVLGRLERLNADVLNNIHKFLWAGLLLSVITGALMAYESIEYLLTVPAFQIKLVFVTALVINSFVIHKHIQVPVVSSFSEVDSRTKKSLLVSGVVSTVSWISVVICAQFLGL